MLRNHRCFPKSFRCGRILPPHLIFLYYIESFRKCQQNQHIISVVFCGFVLFLVFFSCELHKKTVTQENPMLQFSYYNHCYILILIIRSLKPLNKHQEKAYQQKAAAHPDHFISIGNTQITAYSGAKGKQENDPEVITCLLQLLRIFASPVS